jgi:hypothetical protein
MMETPHLQNELRKLSAIRIGSDDVLAAALLWELWQRGVNRAKLVRQCTDGLVLIVEQNSERSVALSRTLAEGFSNRCEAGGSSWHPVRTYNYYRFLDSEKTYTDSSRKDDNGKSEGSKWQPDRGSIDRAEGSAQYDYLRRLSDEIAHLDSDRHFAIGGVKAIGIVASDLYDKLLVLQAMRGRFKDRFSSLLTSTHTI